MRLSREQVRHIAYLARIKLTKEEEDVYSKQLSEILEYMEILNEVDTTDVPISAQVTGLENITRDDTIIECPQGVRLSIIDQFPKKVGNLLKVMTVLKKED